VKVIVGAAVVLAACVLLFFLDLGSAPLNTKGEPRAGLQVQAQLRSGNWILPRLNGRFLPSKPPLFPWLGGLAALATGSLDELALRLPSALLATAIVLVVFWRANGRWGATAGMCASLVLATSFEWLRAAREARVDMTETAFIVGALVVFERAVNVPVPSLPLIGLLYLCVGLAVLAKGPVGIVLPALVGFTYLALRRDLGRLRHLHLVAGTAIVLFIAGSWYALAAASGGTSFMKLVYRENLLRFVRTGGPGGSHVHPFYYYVPGFLTGFLPWSPFLVPLAARLYRDRATLDARGSLYPLVWFVVVFLFFSASAGKRTVYILPAYPAVALLLGAWWSGLIHESSVLTPTLARVLRVVNVVGAAALGAVLLIVIASALGAEPLTLLTPLFHPRDQANVPLVQAILRERAAALGLGMAILLAVTGIFAFSVPRHGWAAVFLWLVVLCGGITTVINAVFYPEFARRRSLKTFLTSIRQVVHDSDDLAFYRTFDFGAVFYAGRDIRELRDLPASAGEQRTYLLIWDDDWQRLAADERARLERLSDSNPTDAKSGRRLILARLRS